MKWSSIVFVAALLCLAAGCGKKEPAEEPAGEPSESSAQAPSKPGPDRVKPVERKEPTLDLAAYGPKPVVEVHTSMGLIVMELDAEKAPKTVQTILSYAEDGFYDGTVFHRIMPGFVIQGGGKFLDTDGTLQNKPPTYVPIPFEGLKGLTHVRGAVALARGGSNIDSASCQFYISLKENPNLDGAYKGKVVRSKAYTVFGKVIEGMDVVDRIAGVELDSPEKGLPANPPTITKVRVRKD